MLNRIAFFSVVGLACTAIGVANAQGVSDLPIGARIKLHTQSDSISQGTLAAPIIDTVLVRPCATCSADSFSLAGLQKLEAFDGRRRTLKSTLLGVLIGGVAGVVIGGTAGHYAERDCLEFCGLAAAYGGIIFGSIGMVTGGTVGLLIKHDAWREVPLRRP